MSQGEFSDPLDGLGPEDLTQEELRLEASSCFGDCDDGELHPDDAQWTYHPALPLSTFLTIFSEKEWREWFEQENRWAVEDGRNSYTYLVQEKIIEPVVLTIINGKVSIWGGWHRTAATFAKGNDTIRAIVGVPKITN